MAGCCLLLMAAGLLLVFEYHVRDNLSQSVSIRQPAGSAANAPAPTRQPAASAPIQAVENNIAAPPRPPAESANKSEQQRNGAKDTKCRQEMHKLVVDYRSKVRQQRDLLRERLEYPVVGSNIATGYIRSYNEAVMNLHGDYSRQAEGMGCSLAEVSPEILPDTYAQ